MHVHNFYVSMSIIPGIIPEYITSLSAAKKRKYIKRPRVSSSEVGHF